MKETTQKILIAGESWLPKILLAIGIIILAIILARIVQKILSRVARQIKLDASLNILFSRSASVIIHVVGIITALGTIGVNVTAIVTSLGLVGFAVGYALKDTIANLLSGVLILLYRPFVIGDKIKVSDHIGKVLAIDFRYTEIDSEHTNVLIPNAKLFTDPITVFDKTESVIKTASTILNKP